MYASLTLLHGTHELLALYNTITVCVLSIKVLNHWLACLKHILGLQITMDKAVLLMTHKFKKKVTDTWQLCQLVARSYFCRKHCSTD